MKPTPLAPIFAVTVALTASTLGAEYARTLGRFFLTSVGLYLLVVACGCAVRAWRAYQQERGRPRTEPDAGPFVIRSVGRVERIAPAEVHWIEGCGNYARLHLDGGRTTLLRKTLASLVDELAPLRFVRVHRGGHLGRLLRFRRRFFETIEDSHR